MPGHVSTIASTLLTNTCTTSLCHSLAILFADIVGFTAWSAKREATSVFALLEAIYAVFDDVAVTRSVFKGTVLYICELGVFIDTTSSV